ncbi:MAG TPA: hypothetical protein VNL69_00080, partial [Bacteroidota bacterium]|nr:hypothetical protein [Bacteroidota bacterium]
MHSPYIAVEVDDVSNMLEGAAMKPTALAATMLLALLALSCKNEPPPAVQVPALELVAEDASCTEAWLRIRSLQVPATVRLMRDRQTVQTLQLTTPDSLL